MSSKLFKSTTISPIKEVKFLSIQKEIVEESSSSIEINNRSKEILIKAEQQAAELFEHAKENIRRKKEQAALEHEEWKRRAQEKVNDELAEIRKLAFEDGYAQGLEQAKEDYLSKVNLAKEVLEKAYVEKERIIKEAEPFVIELSSKIASKIIRKELASEPEVLIHMIKKNLLYSNERSMISICVSPEDFSFVQNQRNQLLEFLEGQIEVKILPEQSIEKGGCIIRTSYGSIDARIDVQLREMKQALLKTQQDEAYEENARD